MNSFISPEQQALLADIAEAKKVLEALHRKLDGIDRQVSDMAELRRQYQLLEVIEESLRELEELDSAELFWGDVGSEAERAEQMDRVRAAVAGFQGKLDEIEKLKEPLYRQIREQQNAIGDLNEDLADLREKEEAAKYEYPVVRKERELPFRPTLMPWSRNGEDDWRFRKTLAAVFLFVLAFNVLLNVWVLPEVDEEEVVEIPEHLVKLVKKEQPKPKPQEKLLEEKPVVEEKPAGGEPKPSETAQARKKAESSGVLAFRESFSDLLGDETTAKLGSAARISGKGSKASGDSNRNLIMAQATSSSSGISTAGLSRQVGGGGGNRIGGVGFSHVTTDIGSGGGGGVNRSLSSGPGPSRSDEEIQIVFDRYKAALYRIYNRELRKNPVLKGKMMLRITIKPDGSVSSCKLESTDMDAPNLVKQILARVKRFNFGPKKGVPTITILYPIDFLPAT